MSVLVGYDTRLVVQGMSGSTGAFHTKQAIEYGTRVVAGVTPGKKGQKFEDKVPVYDTVEQTVKEQGAEVSCIFVTKSFMFASADGSGLMTIWKPGSSTFRSKSVTTIAISTSSSLRA